MWRTSVAASVACLREQLLLVAAAMAAFTKAMQQSSADSFTSNRKFSGAGGERGFL
jgi:hypothetical protein